jgi:hypothetical protein
MREMNIDKKKLGIRIKKIRVNEKDTLEAFQKRQQILSGIARLFLFAKGNMCLYN